MESEAQQSFTEEEFERRRATAEESSVDPEAERASRQRAQEEAARRASERKRMESEAQQSFTEEEFERRRATAEESSVDPEAERASRQRAQEEASGRNAAERERFAQVVQQSITPEEFDQRMLQLPQETLTTEAVEDLVRTQREEQRAANLAAQEYAHEHWMDDLTNDERWLIQHESGFRPDAQNPNSSAFGLGQLLSENRERYGARFGFDADTTIPWQQKMMFRTYVRERYGDEHRARAFWEDHGWY